MSSGGYENVMPSASTQPVCGGATRLHKVSRRRTVDQMKPLFAFAILTISLLLPVRAGADLAEQVVDIPTRPGVTQRFLLIKPPQATAAVILFAGGHGGLQISSDGRIGWGAGNFVVRTRQQFAAHGLVVAVVDAPSDRQSPPYLSGFRQKPEHVADIKAVIAWLREQTHVPVWLIGTSRGTQSAAYVATQLVADGGPDGLVLTSTILTDPKGRAVPEMPLGKLAIPVLVVHHKQDGCKFCQFRDISLLMDKLGAAPRKELIAVEGGQDRGDPCEAKAYHGYNGIESQVVTRIADWILAK
jgi:dienelactone hydrolase